MRSVLTCAAASATVILLACTSVAAQATAPQSAPQSAPAPAASGAASAPMAASPNLMAAGDMASTIKGNSHFTMLAKGLDAANLTPVLKSQPNITLFAPTDEAFAALTPAQQAFLADPKNGPTLQKILTYHVVNLPLDGAKIKGAKGPVKSVEGANLQVDGSTTPPKVNGADIIQVDVKATNGTIHVIDKVLVPPDVTLPQ